MEEVDVKWIHALQVWWSWLWRTMIWVLPISFMMGVLAGITFNMLGINIEENIIFIQLIGGVIGFYFSVKIMKNILSKRFNGYRIALIKVEKSAELDA